MKQNYSNSIFLGGAFREHQILFMLPILDGICKRHKIKKIVFEKDFSKKIKKEKALKNLFKNYQIETIQNIKDHDKSIFNYIVSFSWIVYFFLKSFLFQDQNFYQKMIGIHVKLIILYGILVLLIIKKNLISLKLFRD